MIQATQELIDLLNSDAPLLMADVYTITTTAGQVLRYTSRDVDITVGAYTYTSFRIKRGGIRVVAGLEVDELNVTFYPDGTDLVGSVPFIHAARRGMLDNAAFVLSRAFYSPDWSTYVGSVIRFSGRIADIDEFSRSEVPAVVRSSLELLNTKMPRNIYQPGCRRTLYDSGCGVNKASFAAAGTVASGSTATQINCALAQASGWFDLGTVTFTSGQNSGVTRTVTSYTPGVLRFSLPLPYPPTAGDTFTAYAGCDKQQATCTTKFSNLARFSAEPYVPAAETAY